MKQLKLFVIAISVILMSCNEKMSKTPVYEDVSEIEVPLKGIDYEKNSFPDFGFMVSPTDYHTKYSDQPLFKLKADFPKVKPEKMPEFLEIDFKKEPLKYINAVRDYSFDGNLPDWNPFNNKIRNWYHIPWLHPTTANGGYPPNGGTEGFRGLIKEAPMGALQLGPDMKGIDGDYSVYAITLINDMAGYAMGRMWKDPQNPNITVLDKRFKDGGFPVGTVFAKLLFTDAPKGTDKVAYLVNPLTWKGYITENFWKSDTRMVTDVNLLQMDISVRDSRADRSPDNPEGTGWVFGTFCYNGELNKDNKFMNLVPVGLMWGNDPENRINKTSPFPPIKTEVNKDLKETVIFESDDLPPQHLGWNGRLNGPADLNTVSCLSCHNAAQYPQITSLVPPNASPDGGQDPPIGGGNDEWMKWFQNLECGTSMSDEVYSTDFSFQVAIALQNFFDVKNVNQQGSWVSEYKSVAVPIQRGDPTVPK